MTKTISLQVLADEDESNQSFYDYHILRHNMSLKKRKSNTFSPFFPVHCVEVRFFKPFFAQAAARLVQIVDFPTPPFWLNTTLVFIRYPV